ncbi:MAG: glutamyl-tRNA reductase [Campylobacteraceae bacterium]|nr:glutamyl-tRNA reductase [Campylobacteraceae bacterium]
MAYLSISFTHKNTDIQTREKLAFSNDLEKETFLKNILESDSIEEAVLLSTCNRVEIITCVSSVESSQNTILKKLSEFSTLEYDDLVERADVFDSNSAIHHLFSVASSLDSLVVGETQIVGQLKDSFKYSMSKGFCNRNLARAFHFSFKCAAEVRTATSLGTGSVSVASTAVAKAKAIFKNKSNIKALVIGAGEMSELSIKHLLKANFTVLLTSRNYKKAQLLASTFDEEIEVVPYDQLNRLLNTVEVLITATSAPYPIIKEEMVQKCDFNRYWFDVAVPRDIEDMKIDRLNIYAVDDLQDIVNDNMALRAESAKKAYLIVSNMSKEFFEWLRTLGVEPVLKHLHLNGDDIINKKIQKAIEKGFINSSDEENIKKLCQTVMAEFLHLPSQKLKEVSKSKDGDLILNTVQNIFGLNNESSSIKNSKNNNTQDETKL